MTLLLPPERWTARPAELFGSLSPLVEGVARDLDPVLDRPLHVPDGKAMMSREGGRCPRDGALLEFDPFDGARHRCAVCGGVYEGEAHASFWLYWYHLWLAERAVHAAVLHRLRGEPRHRDLAVAILDGYADRYLDYPNRDNVLGPTRVFFSTYLESIWLLQLCIALDTLEGGDPSRHAALGARVRDRLVEPSAALVATYDEAASNRQAWNVAARIAAARVLHRDDEVVHALTGRHGLTWLLEHGLLADGTWYEGENYHMFAHRGLWYGVAMAEAAGASLPGTLTARFDAGFLAPFLTAMPDLTLPSRRDSQYAISLRQPRFAEPCELGLARDADPRLAGVLATLYEQSPTLAVRSNGRARTSADVERNLAAMRLSRADLGWRALLFARPALPDAEPALPGSVLLRGQGVAVLRRDAGQLYVALDYGHSGGGHGHPDRLNLLLAHGATRWLDDPGTGSYVERTLHWYRSTLAHNAPFVDGHSQARVDGRLAAYDDRGGAGWVRAVIDDLSPGVIVERTVVVMPDYLFDEVRWSADREITFDLPLHAPMEIRGVSDWEVAPLTGGGGLEDGFDFITESRRRAAFPGETVLLSAPPGGRHAEAHLSADRETEWWRLVAPGPPGAGPQPFHMVRMHGVAGRLRAVWSWSPRAARTVSFADRATTVHHDEDLADTHAETEHGWRIELRAGGAQSSIDLAGRVPRDPTLVDGDRRGDAEAERATPITLPAGEELAFVLGEADYRRSEQSWSEAGAPTAGGTIAWDGALLSILVRVAKRDGIVFVAEGAENPLDNEVPETNGDGVQVYVRAAERAGAWTVVPVAGRPTARAVPVRGWSGMELAHSAWRQLPDGWELSVSLELAGSLPADGVVELGLIVNETTSGRARRRGQLVLGGAAGEWTFLRGDRHDPDRLLPIRLAGGELT